MIAFGTMNLAAAGAFLLDVADPRLTEHRSQWVTGRTALATEAAPADLAYRMLAGHFEKVVHGQLPCLRQGPRPGAQQLAADLQELESPFFTDS